MASPEYVESLYSQPLPYENPQPKRVPDPSSQPTPSPEPKPRSSYRREYTAIIILAAAAILLCVTSLMTQASLNKQNIALQDIRQANSTVTSQNTNLEQKVEELSHYGRIMEIAQKMGLTMNEENVRNVTK